MHWTRQHVNTHAYQTQPAQFIRLGLLADHDQSGQAPWDAAMFMATTALLTDLTHSNTP